MLRRLIVVLAAAGLTASAALLPEKFAGYRRSTEATAVKPSDADLWSEFGLTSTERAEFDGPAGRVAITAFRLKDPTGAFAAFEWQRPADAQSGETAASIPGGSLIVHANYLIRTEGKVNPEDATELYKQLPDVVRTSFPPLHAQLPKKGRIHNSERYLLGNVSLARFEPRIPADLAALDRGAEAQSAKYRSPQGEIQLTIISYPTPQMAILFARKLEGVSGLAVRRSGPLVTVIPEGAGNPFAQRMLADINYAPSLTWNEFVPKDTPQDAARMILAIVALAAGLIVLSLVLGLTFGGSKFLAKRMGWVRPDEGFTSLHLEEK